jgi:tRNA(Arg) A34 adenosine deaminase TadA
MSELDHMQYMRRAIELTAHCPALPFGAVVVHRPTGDVVAEGWKQIEIAAEELVRRAPGMRCRVLGGVLEDECQELFLTIGRAAPGR